MVSKEGGGTKENLLEGKITLERGSGRLLTLQVKIVLPCTHGWHGEGPYLGTKSREGGGKISAKVWPSHMESPGYNLKYREKSGRTIRLRVCGGGSKKGLLLGIFQKQKKQTLGPQRGSQRWGNGT